MNLKKCENGHYYDADTYLQCPHCIPKEKDILHTTALDGNTDVPASEQKWIELENEKRMLHFHGVDLYHRNKDAHISITRDSFMIGRDLACDYVISGNEKISRQHLILERTPDFFGIRDNHSKNGVYLNGTRIQPDQSIPVRITDVIQIDKDEFCFKEMDPDAVAIVIDPYFRKLI